MRLEAEKLSFAYADYENGEGVKVLKGVSFSLSDNENILILGEPESGKTTLSLLIAALIPAYFDGEKKGNITIDGEESEKISPLCKKLSLVPQDSASFVITQTVFEEIVYPLESLETKREEMEVQLKKALSDWGLERLREAGTDELSGGEKRRLMLAAAEVTEPAFVLYDESFDDLDESWRKTLAQRIKERKHGSLVLASHYLDLFDELFDRVYTLSDGVLTEGGVNRYKTIELELKLSEKRGRKDLLSVENLTFERRRHSSLSIPPFELSVPSFTLKSGEIVSLQGDNGSGKSTFSRILCGLDAPLSGAISINGKKADSKLLLRSVGYMFQNPDYQIFLPTVKDELSYSLAFLDLTKEEKEKRLEEIALLFELKLGDVASLMSYGARKRLQAAIYYNLDRPFYILDELDSALSYKQALKFVSFLTDRGAAILLISHDSRFSSSISDRAYEAREGRIYEKK